jgi:hypothetical protein
MSAEDLKVQPANNDSSPPQPIRIGNGPNGRLRVGNPHWGKGVSGNPAGRPKNEPLLSPEMRRQLKNVCPFDAAKRTWLEVIVEKTMHLAAYKGNPAAIKEVWERIDGKVKENIQLDIQLQQIRAMTDDELEAIIAGKTLAENVG